MSAGLALVVLLLSSVSTVQAAGVGLLWSFDRGFTPPPDVFRLTAMQASGAQQQFQVRPHPPGACTRLPKGTAEDFCTVLPCPAPGSLVAYWVQAVWPEATTGPVEVAQCWFKPGPTPCVCEDPATAIPPMTHAPEAPRPDAPMPPPAAPPPLPQRSAEGLNLQPIGPVPELSTIPAIPPSGGA